MKIKGKFSLCCTNTNKYASYSTWFIGCLKFEVLDHQLQFLSVIVFLYVLDKNLENTNSPTMIQYLVNMSRK